MSGDRAGCWENGKKGETQLLLPLPGSSGASAHCNLKVKGQERCGQDRTATAGEDLFPDPGTSVFWLDTPCLAPQGLSFCPGSFRTQWLADLGIHFHHCF